MNDQRSLPVMCALTPGDLRDRLASIERLTRDALLGFARDGLELRLRYAPNAAGCVHAMVAAEQLCCAFLVFDVRERPDAVHVTITVPESARSAAFELFEQFIAGVNPHP